MTLSHDETQRIASALARAEIARLNRRRLLAAGVGAAGVALAGQRATRAQDSEVTTLTIMSYGGLYGDAQKAAVFDPYEQETGVTLNLVTGQSALPVLTADAAKEEPDYDIVLLTNIEFYTARKQGGLLAEYDENNIPNLADILPIANAMPYAANVELDPWGLLYNTDQVDPKPDSWEVLWDPQYQNRVGFEPPTAGGDEVFNLIACALVAGGTQQDVSTVGIEQAKKLQGQARFADGATALTFFQSQEIVVMPWFNNEAYFMAAEGFPADFAWPKEGAFPVAVWLGMPHNLSGARKAAAERFINYYLSPPPQEAMAKAMFAGPTNKNVQLDEELQEKVLYGERVEQAVQVDWDYVIDNQEGWIDQWNREVAG